MNNHWRSRIYEPRDEDDYDFDDGPRAMKMLGGLILFAFTLAAVGCAFTFWNWAR